MSEKKDNLTIYDISRKAGVSIATVSRVLNGSDNVHEKTRTKILSIIEECGYKPNAFARGLGLNSMKTIGILFADSSDAYLSKAVFYIEENLRAEHYASLLCCTGYELESKKGAMKLLLDKKVDAVILVGSNFIYEKDSDNDYIREASKSVPVMVLNARFDCDNVYSLYCDDYNAVKSAVTYLIEKGRKKILYLYNSESYSGLLKRKGYISALEAQGIPFNKDLCVFVEGGPDDIETFVDTINNLCENGLVFDSVCASEDYLAISALKYAIKKKINVPKDISIIGYNNSSLSLLCEPELSSIDNKLYPLSNKLVENLMKVLKGQEVSKSIEYPGTLVNRLST